MYEPTTIPQSDPLLCGREVVRNIQKKCLSDLQGNLQPRWVDRDQGSLPVNRNPKLKRTYPQVERRDASNLSYEEFLTKYLIPNKPVLIEGATSGWRVATDWVRPDGSPDVDAIERVAGQALVQVTETSRDSKACGVCRTMTFREYAEWWRRHKAERTAAKACLRAPPPRSLQYLKDWHFAGGFPHYKAYDTPVYFSSDWLNAYYDSLAPQRVEGPAEPRGRCRSDGRDNRSTVDNRCVGDDVDVYASDERQSHAQTRRASYPVGDGSIYHANAGTGTGDDKDGDISNAEFTKKADTSEEDGQRGSCSGSGSGDSSSSHSCIPVECCDYRFVYLGPEGTCTPLHADVMHSYSWSANVAGEKRWLLLPPEYTHMLYDMTANELADSFGESDSESGEEREDPHEPGDEARADTIASPAVACAPLSTTSIRSSACSASGSGRSSRFPLLSLARGHLLECIQTPGSALFVPSGWHHTVRNRRDTLSLNHNWMNAANSHWCWCFLRQQREDAAEGIADIRLTCSDALEFEDLVQRNVKVNAGIDWADWIQLMKTNVNPLVRRIQERRRGAAEAKKSHGREQGGEREGKGNDDEQWGRVVAGGSEPLFPPDLLACDSSPSSPAAADEDDSVTGRWAEWSLAAAEEVCRSMKSEFDRIFAAPPRSTAPSGSFSLPATYFDLLQLRQRIDDVDRVASGSIV